MEDAHAIELNIDENEKEANAFFAVYDGHGGELTALSLGHNWIVLIRWHRGEIRGRSCSQTPCGRGCIS